MGYRHFQDWITLLVGALLVITPFMIAVVAPDGTSTLPLLANFVACGVAAIVLAFVTLFAFRQWEEWLEIGLGLWLIASPWVLGFTYANPAIWAAVLGGAVIVAMGVWTRFEDTRAGRT